MTAEKSVKCGVTGTHMKVLVHGQEEGHVSHENHEHSHDHHGHHHEHDHEHEHTHDHHDDNHHHDAHHHHHGVNDIKEMIQALAVSDKVKEDALAVYQIIARAESQVHGVEMDQIHFHEVGTLDAIADVVGNCILMETIGAEKIIVSPIHVGSGNVHCAHGILPVPAPATALILQGIPYYSGSINGELCTPTGAALLKYFATEFGPMPVMQVNHIGYGMGYKEFEQANCIRVMLGETVEKEQGPDGQVLELACNLDDMTGEEIGFAAELLLEAGALDVRCV